MFTRVLVLLVAFGISMTAYAEGEPTPEALGKQFDAQVARLTERGYPKLFGEPKIFDKMMAKLREEAVRYVPAKPGYTFLIVIPQNYAPLAWQARQIVLPSGEVCGALPFEFAFLESADIKNNGAFAIPAKPYLLTDVDVGDATANRWICDVGAELTHSHRRGLTLIECMSLLVQHPELLSRTRIAALGTSIEDPAHKQNTRCAYWSLGSATPHHPYVSMAEWDLLNRSSGGDWYMHMQFPTCKE